MDSTLTIAALTLTLGRRTEEGGRIDSPPGEGAATLHAGKSAGRAGEQGH